MASIPRPGVEVVQEIRRTTPTVVQPAFVPCIVGPCMDLMEARTSAGGANPNAKVSVPATATGTDSDANKDVSELSIRAVIDGGADQEVELPISPTGSLIATSLIVTSLELGLTGVRATSVSNRVKFTTTSSGEGSSIRFKKAKMKIAHGAVTSGPFQVGDELVQQGTESNVVGVVTTVGSGYVIVETLDGNWTPVATNIVKTKNPGAAFATVSSTKTAYTELGLSAFVDLTIEGATTYKNRALTLPFDDLPVNKGQQGQLLFDASKMSIFRLQSGRLSELWQDAAVLRSRSHITTTTLQQARRTVPSAQASSASTAVTYTSKPGLNGSEVSVVHRAAVVVNYDTLVGGPFTIGETIIDTTDSKVIGVVLDDDGALLTVGLLGTAAIGDLTDDNALEGMSSGATCAVDAAATPGGIDPVALSWPTVLDGASGSLLEARILKLAYSGLAGGTFSAGTTLVNGSTTNNQYTIGKILHVDGVGAALVVEITGAAPGVGDTLKVAGVTATLDTITPLTPRRRVVVYFGVDIATAAHVADVVNRDEGTSALVTADVGGSPPGSGNAVASATTEVFLQSISVSSGDPARMLHTGLPYDDRDGDSLTPYFWTRGRYASLTHGSGTSALTFEARGAQDLTNPGSYHGDDGNSLAVNLIDAPVTSVTVSVTSGVISVLFKGSQNGDVHTASDIAAAVNGDSVAGKMVIATAGGAGAVSGLHKTYLYGGADPINFQDTPAKCLVQGQRDVAHFGYIKVTCGAVDDFDVGETLRLTSVSGTVVGVIREIISAYNVLWVDPIYHSGTAQAGGNTTIRLQAALAIKVTDVYKDWNVRVLSGTGTANEIRTVTAFETVNLDATVGEAWSVNPGGDTAYRLEAPGTITSGATVVGETSGASAVVTDVTQAGVAQGDTLTLRVGGGPEIVVTFEATFDLADVKTKVNAAVASLATLTPTDASTDPTSVLRLTVASGREGIESTLELGGSAVEQIFGLMPGGLTYAGIHEGQALKLQPGDELYNGTTLLGTVSAIEDVKVGSQTFTKGRIKVSRDSLATSTSYTQWWVKAKNITLSDAYVPEQVNSADRPTPGAIVKGSEEEIVVAPAQARLTDGQVDQSANYSLYVDYDALRLDVVDDLVSFSTTTELDARLGPISPENPLCWGLYCAMLNATTVKVSGIGVNETSEVYPEGTLEAYTRALELLEAKNVYALALLTQDRDILSLVKAHVLKMSQPSRKRPRIAYLNHAQPTEEEPTSVGSGTGVLSAINTIDVDPLSLNVVDALMAEGFDNPNAMSWSDFKEAGIYLQITSDTKKYSVASISGQVITVAVSSFEPGENDDSFYSETGLDPDALDMDPSGEIVTLKIRGADIDESTLAGRDRVIEALGAVAQSYVSDLSLLENGASVTVAGGRRIRFVQPAQVGMDYNGSEILVPGYYACAMLCGKRAQHHPSQPFSNLELVGLKSVQGSNDKFTEDQLDDGAGLGIWWLIKEGASVLNRHQLTTDVSSIETREDSITTAIDYAEMFLRASVRKVTGSNNITDRFLDQMSIVAQGSVELLTELAVWASGDLNNLVQDLDNPDTVLADVTAKPLFPCNRVRFTIVI